MQGGPLELNGVSATAQLSGLHTSILKHAPSMHRFLINCIVLKKADQDKFSLMSATASQVFKTSQPTCNHPWLTNLIETNG